MSVLDDDITIAQKINAHAEWQEKVNNGDVDDIEEQRELYIKLHSGCGSKLK